MPVLLVHNADPSMVAPFGPLATMSREPRQARKGATVAVKSCAGVWLIGDTTLEFRLASSESPGNFPASSPTDIIDRFNHWAELT